MRLTHRSMRKPNASVGVTSMSSARASLAAFPMGIAMTRQIDLHPPLQVVNGCGRMAPLPPAASPRAESARNRAAAQPRVSVRFLELADVPALMRLEHAAWEPHQAACADDIAARIQAYPRLSIGAFCNDTGRALASLFAKPAHAPSLRAAASWRECAAGPDVDERSRSSALFGISLSSIEPKAGKAIFGFFWPHALKSGWREMYLGSPVPGLRAWLGRHPEQSAEDYARTRLNGLPRDPQLRYYFRKGFKKIVAVRPNYFPHAGSLDYGVILGGRIPLSSLSALWRLLPLTWLQAMGTWLFVLR